MPATGPWVFVWGRLVRDAGAEVLPVSQMGGCVLGARAVVLAGVPASLAAASTVVDLTLEFVAKLAYMALGLGLLGHLRPDKPVALPVTIGLTATGLFALAFIVVQRHGFGLFDRFARRLGRGWAERMAAGAAALQTALGQIYRRRRRLWGGFLLHLACWILSAVEVWVGPPLRRRAARLWECPDHREPALRRPHRRLRHPQCRRRSGRGLYPDRCRFRADTGDGARDLAVETGA